MFDQLHKVSSCRCHQEVADAGTAVPLYKDRGGDLINTIDRLCYDVVLYEQVKQLNKSSIYIFISNFCNFNGIMQK